MTKPKFQQVRVGSLQVLCWRCYCTGASGYGYTQRSAYAHWLGMVCAELARVQGDRSWQPKLKLPNT
jgi:hypothetical protein